MSVTLKSLGNITEIGISVSCHVTSQVFEEDRVASSCEVDSEDETQESERHNEALRNWSELPKAFIIKRKT